jgi:hypothetical protein
MRPFLRTGLILALLTVALAPAIAPAPAVAAGNTLVRPARFESSQSAIVVPFSGAAPTFSLYRLSDTHYYYEFEGTTFKGGVQNKLLTGPIERFTIANRPNGVVRLSLKLTRPATPYIQIDNARGLITVLPLGEESPAQGDWITPTTVHRDPAPKRQTAVATPRPQAAVPVPPRPVAVRPVAPAPTPVPVTLLPRNLQPPTAANAVKTALGRPFFDDFHHRLVLPFSGPPPEFKVHVYDRNPRWVYLEFEGAGVQFEGERQESYTSDPFDGWLMSQRPGSVQTRFYLKFKQATPLVAQVYPESGEVWFVVPTTQQGVPEAPASPGSSVTPTAPEPAASL